jgi:hypothetical protein
LTSPTIRARATTLDIARAVPAWAWLSGIVVLSAAVRVALAQKMVAPWIMVDELIYSELAKSFAESGHFLVRGEAATGYGFVYPLLIAPAYRLFHSVPDAYTAAKTINSVLMSLAALPAYFLARRVVSEPLALVAAVLAVAIPSLLYTGTLMTENAFYPLFLCVSLVLVRMLEAPTWRNQLGLLALWVLAYETRAQAVALLAAIVVAPAVLGWRGLPRFRVLYGTLGGVVLAVLLAQVARGRSPLSVLGAYETTGHQHYSASKIATWLLWHAGELSLYVGVVPVIAFVVAFRREPFFAAAATVTGAMLLVVSAFATLPTVERIEERNLFYVAPFFFVALLAWIERGARKPRWTLAAAAVAAALPATVPYARFIGVTATADTLSLTPWWNLQEHVISLGQVRLAVALCAAAVALAFVLVPARFALAFPLLLLVYFAVEHQPIEARASFASRGAMFQGIQGQPADWIDKLAGARADVAAIWTGTPDPHVIWENEFFNRSVGRVYATGDQLPPTSRDSPRVETAPDGYLRDALGRLVRHRFVLVDGSLDLNGTKLATEAPIGMNLWRLRGPVRSLTRVEGLYPNDSWSGASVVYRHLECTGGSVRVTLFGDVHLFDAPQTVRANGVTKRVKPGVPTPMEVPLRNCRARFVVSPTRTPKDDPRVLGIHFLSFEYRPS